MISIRRFLDRPDQATADDELLAASLQLRELLLDGTPPGALAEPAAGTESGTNADQVQRLENATTPAELLAIAGQAVEAARNQARQAVEFREEHRRQMHAVVAMLTEALADISGQADTTVAQLQEIEQQIEKASTPEDIRALKQSLANCLTAVKHAIAEQRKATLTIVERLQEQAQRSQAAGQAPPAPAANNGRPEAEYVAVFRLQRAEHIEKRFGDAGRDEMLGVISEVLKSIQGPNDRLTRWKGPSFVMFLNSADHLIFVRRRLGTAVARIGQRYVELGKNSALLAVGVDWTIFQQARYASLDLALAEVDAFLNESGGKA